MTGVPPEKAIASFDSSSAFLTALARALDGRDFPYLGQSSLKVPLVRASALLPLSLRRRVYAIASGQEGVPPDRLDQVDLERVAAWITAHYPARRYPGVLLGSSNGALAHLAAAAGLPWLPQTLLVPVRRPRADPRDAAAALDFGARHAPALLEGNPTIELHHMHDANQDALSASQMAYFRVKWHVLPQAYQAFLAETLEPGAPVIVVRDRSSWPVTRVGPRHVFQYGAQGGMSAEEYSAEPGAPGTDEVAAEAEWGFAEALGEAIRGWATRNGHPVVEVSYGHPQDPAAGVADIFRDWLRQRGQPAQRLLVSSFIVHDPWRTLTTASVPFWTFFPVRSAAADLAEYLDRATYEDVDILLFSNGVPSRGQVDARSWEALAGRAQRRGRLLGVDADAFPADFTAFVRYTSALRSLPTAAASWPPLGVADMLTGLEAAPPMAVARPDGDPAGP
ncbi:hypothetical protein [Blastococcus saxobsidens]|uniref:Uncharacterized protein n=1 Tax=Blastococcus saxobsidens (strain DD2) TaxID=1146883 RepID=H6RQW9_BLASD|nr:hypothetical protein [Blastococcus saxobsidens]CCG02848.1 Putative uncharacterized protein [Blastococcus saxobsidens DD2]